MIDPKLQAAYDACAKEPIHLSGAIQPHGVLLAYAPRSGRIVAASDNVEGLFGTKASELLGQPIAELFDAHAMQLIQAHAMACQPGDFPRLAGMINAGEWGELHHLSVHVWNQLIHVELEPAERESVEPVDAHAMIAKLETGEKSAPFFEAVAQQVHELTGYDRVMVYAFRHDHSGEVVAQALGGQLSSYMGLRFPASDIPPQARALYLSNRVRVIPDVRYTPVPVVATQSATPLDMSFDVLRSVSPIHLDYLRNMGVCASMSISIIVDGRLWGLIACHHHEPKPVGARQRIAADVFGRYVSLLLSTRNLKQIGAKESLARVHRDRLERLLSDSPSPLDTLRRESASLLGALPADSFALVTKGHTVQAGPALGEHTIEHALEWARAHASHAAEGTVERDDWTTLEDGPAGLFAIPLNGGSLGWLLLFRQEQVEHVRWAGSPSDAYQLDAGSLTIGPRTSFEEWNETVRGTSEPWSDEDAERAERLRLLLLRALHAGEEGGGARLDPSGRLVRLDTYGHRRRLNRVANLLGDAGDHLGPGQRQRFNELLTEMEAILTASAESGQQQATG